MSHSAPALVWGTMWDNLVRGQRFHTTSRRRVICHAFPHAARQTSTGPKSLRKVAPLQFKIRISTNQQVDMLIRAWFHPLSPNGASAKFNCHTQRDHVHRIDVTQRSSVSLMAEEQTSICMWTGIPRCSQLGFKNNASRPTCVEAFISSPALGRATLILMRLHRATLQLLMVLVFLQPPRSLS